MPPSTPSQAALGSAIREMRARQGLSQEELAHRSGLDRTYYSGVERGVRNPTFSSILKIATALGVPASEIVARAEVLHTAAPRRREPGRS